MIKKLFAVLLLCIPFAANAGLYDGIWTSGGVGIVTINENSSGTMALLTLDNTQSVGPYSGGWFDTFIGTRASGANTVTLSDLTVSDSLTVTFTSLTTATGISTKPNGVTKTLSFQKIL